MRGFKDSDDGGPSSSSFASPMAVPSPERFVNVLEQLAESMRKNNVAMDSALRIPTIMRETAVDASGTATQLITSPQSSNMFLVRQVAFFLPPGASGLLVLDDIQLPVGPGASSLGWFQLLNTDAVRLLRSSVAGTMSLTLMGELYSRSMLFR